MGGTAQLCLALDVDHTLLAHIYFSGDARRAPKGKFTNFVNRQCIDLSNDLTIHIDHDLIV